MKVEVRVDKYAYGEWFEVIRMDRVDNEVIIRDHLLGGIKTFSMDGEEVFRVKEES